MGNQTVNLYNFASAPVAATRRTGRKTAKRT